MLGINDIIGVLQQRYPFIFVDRILEYKHNEYSVGCKNVTMNEFWAQGHFEGDPVLPGVLLIEASAQTGAFIFYNQDVEDKRIQGKICMVNSFKFVRMVKPGDQLIIRAELVERVAYLAKVRIKVTVEGKRTAEGEISYAFTELS